ncbi:GNAT family N-acetyltransferase [Alkalihalophilus pseudofirmus]|uniref:GNAT family N-acetyltransferase n=1 Tax=Alkalihalophilus pseudofirmus TaxID=79885 RepID=UPI00259BDBCA|nr:GNAT family N-acetyltransferase [Alkalihalophilus pseudofirmus]WEG15268.1 GNAT family N-acetyltransferase [Alkalihalophilus pseudofirmus]
MLESKRCIIRAFQRSDIREIRKLYKSEEVRKYLGGVPQAQTIDASLKEMERPKSGSYYWIIREKQTDEFIGLASLDPHHDGVNIELSYQLLPRWWGRGYATEILQVIIPYALNDLNLSKIVTETQTANIASCRLLEKVGMKKEQILFRFGAEQAIYSLQKKI